ncbi:MAG: exosortase/archaeosortase family protein [Limisphaera sp.]
MSWLERAQRRDAALWAPALLVVGWMAFRLLEGLSLVWSLNPQYAYGWAVPVLCGYLAWQRWERARSETSSPASPPGPSLVVVARPGTGPAASEGSTSWPTVASGLCAGVLALLYAAARLLQEANPWWSLVHWMLSLAFVGTVLWFLSGAGHLLRVRRGPGSRILDWRQFVFPVAFLLVAVPWPYTITEPVIQALARWNTIFTIEVLAWVGIPAVQHGNVIELATGKVGVDEACSGIRSLQGTLMLSLFFGEFYLLSVARRCALVGIGLGLALTGNLGRTLTLTMVAARRGEEAIAAWHDPAGISILLFCCAGVWWAAHALHRSTRPPPSPPRAPVTATQPSSAAPSDPQTQPDPVGVGPAATRFTQRFGRAGMAWLLWVILVDAGVAGWYRWTERDLTPGPDWELHWPSDAPALQEVPMAKAARELLQYDEARQVRWNHVDGTSWQILFLRWAPGRAAGYLAKSHSPLVCMPAAGYPVESVSPVRLLPVEGLQLPYRLYRFGTEAGPVHVLYSRWDEGAARQSFSHETAGPWSRLSSVWMGRGSRGQRVLVVAVWGIRELETAEARLREELAGRLRVKLRPSGNSTSATGPLGDGALD